MHACINSFRSIVNSATCVAVACKNEELHVPALRMRVCACLIACRKGQAAALVTCVNVGTICGISYVCKQSDSWHSEHWTCTASLGGGSNQRQKNKVFSDFRKGISLFEGSQIVTCV